MNMNDVYTIHVFVWISLICETELTNKSIKKIIIESRSILLVIHIMINSLPSFSLYSPDFFSFSTAVFSTLHYLSHWTEEAATAAPASERMNEKKSTAAAIMIIILQWGHHSHRSAPQQKFAIP